jgi:hypothetical protein
MERPQPSSVRNGKIWNGEEVRIAKKQQKKEWSIK